MEHTRLTFTSALLWLLLQATQASLYMDIRLLEYRHDCVEYRLPFYTNYCDPRFTFCITRPMPKSDIKFKNESCYYSFVKKSSNFDERTHINFQTLGDDKKGLPIPWKFKVDQILDSEVLFAVDIHDDDDFLSDDHVLTLAINMTLDISPSENETNFQAVSLEEEDDDHKFTYEIALYCVENFYGENCQIYCLATSDDSGHYTCENGTGHKICTKGWLGKDCNKRDPCEASPCVHGGTCNSDLEHFNYTCSCPPGWLGERCEVRFDPCDSRPCLNAATCNPDLEHLNYTCVCVSGWLGERCEEWFEPCVSKPCENDAICDENIMTHSYHCSCQSGWEGTHCEIKSDPCLLQPCQNSGTCHSSQDHFSYTCYCPYGWEGDDCENRIDPCDSAPCQNNASCHGNREYSNYTCSCPPGQLGENCEKEYKPCASQPCQHGGQCQADLVFYTYECVCASGWEGDECGIPSNPCDPSPCQNRGTCQASNLNYNYMCTCLETHTGRHCETDIFDGVTPAGASKSSSTTTWRIPVAIIAAVIFLIIIVLMVIVWRRRRRNESKSHYVSDSQPPVVVFQRNGTSNLAFENNTYNSQLDLGNQEIEIGMANGITPPQPIERPEDDLFNPVLPGFQLDYETRAAVGGASHKGEDCRDKKTEFKSSDTDGMDGTDLRYSKVSTLSKRPVTERVDENPYQDFRLLSADGQAKEDQPGDDEEEHYKTLDEVFDSVKNSNTNSEDDAPPPLPPFNVGVEKNHSLKPANNSNMNSSSLNTGENNFNELFENDNPWKTDPFAASPPTQYEPNQTGGKDDHSDGENQDDIARLRREVREFMEKTDTKDRRQSSSNA